jgi:hypothetical protein
MGVDVASRRESGAVESEINGGGCRIERGSGVVEPGKNEGDVASREEVVLLNG